MLAVYSDPWVHYCLTVTLGELIGVIESEGKMEENGFWILWNRKECIYLLLNGLDFVGASH